jgi:two-component system, LuxR family, sensor kinase FixL
MIEVVVSDTGSGFHDDVKQNLFQTFFTTKDTGMGVGLSISRSIIEAHGGQMWAESNDSGGATFRFTLPAASSESLTDAT